MKCPEYLIDFLKNLNTEQVSDVLKVFFHGYEKHGESKWQPVCVNIDRAYAHLLAANYETIEEESGLPNRAHATARLLIAAI